LYVMFFSNKVLRFWRERERDWKEGSHGEGLETASNS
jgi:hypothetical protein